MNTKRIMKWLLIIVAIPVVALAAMFLVGMLLPAKHTLARSITLKVKPEVAFGTIAKVEELPSWSSGVLKVERLPDRDGRETTMQTLKGGMKMEVITSESLPPTHLVRTMGDSSAPFFGSWAYDFSAAGEGCRVIVRETGEVKNPLFRTMSRLFGLDKHITQHLNDLARKLGETAHVEVI